MEATATRPARRDFVTPAAHFFHLPLHIPLFDRIQARLQARIAPSPIRTASDRNDLPGHTVLNGRHHGTPHLTEPSIASPAPQVESNNQDPSRSSAPLVSGNSQQERNENGNAIQPVIQNGTAVVPTSSANLSAALIPSSEAIEAPVVDHCSVEIPLDKYFTERLDKSKGTYINKAATIPDSLNVKWQRDVQPELEKQLRFLVPGLEEGKKTIEWTTAFYMVGTRAKNSNHEDVLNAKPNIVITCGARDCVRKLETLLGTIQMHHLVAFDQPITVRYVRTQKWAAHPGKGKLPATTSEARLSTLQDVAIERSSIPSLSGLKMKFSILQDGAVHRRYATVGGIIGLDESLYFMTTAHTFLADLDSIHAASTSEETEDYISDWASHSDSTETPPISVPSIPYNAMDFTSIWTSNMEAAMTYSFLGETTSMNSPSSLHPSSSDWALIELSGRDLLSLTALRRAYKWSVTPALQLTPGDVEILDSVNATHKGFLTQTSVSIRAGHSVMYVREVLLRNSLFPGASGSWIVRGDKVCGYVVAISGTGRSCFMVTMEQVIQEMGKVSGKMVKLGYDLDKSMKQVIQEMHDLDKSIEGPANVVGESDSNTLTRAAIDWIQSVPNERIITTDNPPPDLDISPNASNTEALEDSQPMPSPSIDGNAPATALRSDRFNKLRMQYFRRISRLRGPVRPATRPVDVNSDEIHSIGVESPDSISIRPPRPTRLSSVRRIRSRSPISPIDIDLEEVHSIAEDSSDFGPVQLPRPTQLSSVRRTQDSSLISPMEINVEENLSVAEESSDLGSVQPPRSRRLIDVLKFWDRSRSISANRYINPDEIHDITGRGHLHFGSLPGFPLAGSFPGFPSLIGALRDPKDVKKWSPSKKRLNFCIILSLTCLSTLASTMIVPGIPLIMHDLHSDNKALGSLITSSYILGQLAGPLLLVPLSDVYGRRITYHVSNVLFVIFNIACAVAPNVGSLIAFRLLAGCFAACPLTVGHQSIEDLYIEKKDFEQLEAFIRDSRYRIGPKGMSFFIFRERSRPIAVLTIASMVGASIGPIAGGYLAQHASWHFVFWAISILGVLLEVGALGFMSETKPRRYDFRSSLPQDGWRHLWALRNQFTRSLSRAVQTPNRLLRSSRKVLYLVAYLALMKGYSFLFYTMLATTFTPGYPYTTRWHLGPGKSGLTFLAIFIGTITGSFIGYVLFQWAHERINKMISRSRKGARKYQLLPLLPSSLIVSGSVIGFGWSVVRANGLIVILLAPLGASLGISLTVLTIEAFLSNEFAPFFADAMAVTSMLASLTGGLYPVIGQLLADNATLGIKWTYTIFGILSLLWYIYIGLQPKDLVPFLGLERRSTYSDDSDQPQDLSFSRTNALFESSEPGLELTDRRFSEDFLRANPHLQ